MTTHKLDKAQEEIRRAAQLEFNMMFPDEYLIEEDQMGDSHPQEVLIDYLKSVLRHLYRFEKWLVAGNLNHYHNEIENTQHLIVPDVAVFKGIEISSEEQQRLSSWNMRQEKRDAPPLVIEVSSEGTYRGDVGMDKKPRSYGLIGVKEYFAYDPHEPQIYPKKIGKRLLGWRYGENKQPVAIEPDERGRLWSEVLESWLMPDGAYLRLYDRDGQMRLTWAEAEELAKEAERQRAEAERLAKEAERQRAEVERLAKEAELLAREAEQAAKEKAWAKLRELGIDPETL